MHNSLQFCQITFLQHVKYLMWWTKKGTDGPRQLLSPIAIFPKLLRSSSINLNKIIRLDDSNKQNTQNKHISWKIMCPQETNESFELVFIVN